MKMNIKATGDRAHMKPRCSSLDTWSRVGPGSATWGTAV